MNIFLDSSVLLSFCWSKRGASALIIAYCRQGKLKGYISPKVAYEVEKNNTEYRNKRGAERFQAVLERNILTVIEDSSEEELEKAQRAVDNDKDAPIIAAAKHAPQIAYVVSLDKGFFKPAVQTYLTPMKVISPGEFIQKFREELEK